MSRWFRSYADTHRNPKIAKLSDRDFRLWHNLLCIAAENDGVIPPAEDLKHMLRMRLDHTYGILNRLIEGSLIDPLEAGYAPRNWDKRQYKSDTSTPRVQKFRGKGNVSCNVSETPPDTDTETETEKEITVVPNPARAADCFNEICKAADWRPRTDSKRQEALSIIDGWLALGCSLDLILESIKYCSRNGEATSSLRRFDGLIRKKRREQLGGALPLTPSDVAAISQRLGRQMRAA